MSHLPTTASYQEFVLPLETLSHNGENHLRQSCIAVQLLFRVKPFTLLVNSGHLGVHTTEAGAKDTII